MVDFYKRLQAGEGKARALQNAGLALMKARQEKYGAAHPLFWGAFVCVGNPE
jgi:CHAT domain-containing protein